jgi:protein SCO1/2
MKKKPFLLLVFAQIILIVLCAAIFSRPRPALNVPATAQTFQVRGQIRELDAVNRMVRIAHEEIPHYMPAMTMPFAVKDTGLLKGLSIGDAVQFELVVTGSDSWISHIDKIRSEIPAAASGAQAPAATESDLVRLEPGESVPDFTLIDQNNRPIQLSGFRGKAVVLTFIYTRCPLPNFCPLMSANFAELQKRLSREYPDRYQLLSISMDPEFDRPAVLKGYAARYQADERHWTFATGTKEQIDFVAGLVALFHEPENGLISHDLRTALIGPDGRLVHVWKSNAWTPYEVQRMVGETLSVAKDYAKAR